MQTLFLVWLPGLGGLSAGLGVLWWLGGKAYETIHRVRREKAEDRLVIDQALLLKEICGTTYLPDDITERVNKSIGRVEAMTRKELR